MATTTTPVASQTTAESNFSSALSVWKDINLQELQRTLDAQGLEIVDNQKENMVGRKKLAEQTREFKKIPDDDKVTAFKGLLKAYQTEIDNLTKRSKSAENAFLNVYKLLAEAPDPFPLLDAAVDQTARASEARLLESELARQKEENASLKQRLADAQTVEKDKKKLQEKVEKFESKMEEMIQEKVAQKEAELNATYDERIRNYEERERDLQKQVAVVREQLRDLRTSNDSTQAKLLDHSQRQDQETVARLAELDLITGDLERANSRVTEVERRNEKLRAEIEAVRSGSESAEKVRTLESQISDLQSEASRLLRKLEVQKEETDRERQEAKRRMEEREKEHVEREKEVANLRDKVRQRADYDEVKRELEIMKFVEFSGMSLDEGAEGEDDESVSDAVRLPDPNADKANLHRGKPLESLLMGKNRKMQDELTSLRVAHEELSNTYRTLQADSESLQSKLDEQRTLNSRLENDLLRVNGSGSSGSNGVESRGSGAATPVGRADPLAGLNLGKKSMENGLPSAPSMTAEASILPIITSQRDRFRQRNGELEEELRRQYETISELRNEIKSLQVDNLKLYEKVRYLQSYRDDGPSTSRGYSLTPSAGRDEELGKYRNMYEERMNPFEAFKGREQTRAVQALNPLEKILLSLASLILGNRTARNLFMLYTFALHFFVMVTLFELATTSGTLRDVSPPPIMPAAGRPG